MFLFTLTFNVKFTLNINQSVKCYGMTPIFNRLHYYYHPLDQLTIYKDENQDIS